MEVHGHQPGPAYNDHFRCRCYHPLVLPWSRGDFLAARLRTNAVLERKAEPYVRRPPGRPPKEGRAWTHELTCRAGPRSRERRVVLVVTERPGEQGPLFLDPFFLLTNAPEDDVSAEELPVGSRRVTVLLGAERAPA